MSIYQSNTYRKGISWLHLDEFGWWTKDSRGAASEGRTILRTCPDMKKIIHTRSDGRFIEIQSNIWRKKLRRTIKGSNFLGGSFGNWDNETKEVEFFQHWNKKVTSCPSPQCLVGQIQIQKPTWVVATNQMPDLI